MVLSSGAVRGVSIAMLHSIAVWCYEHIELCEVHVEIEKEEGGKTRCCLHEVHFSAIIA
jgi:hypothetical protein